VHLLRGKGLSALVIALALGCSSPRLAATPPAPLFSFQSNFWLNLHHFARAVARGMPAPPDLSAAESAAWNRGVAFYRERYMNRDLLFDPEMVAIKNRLRVLPDSADLGSAGLDPELAATLGSLAPIYRQRSWPEHNAANHAWIAAVRPLVARHGAAIARRVAAAYGETWPSAAVPVDLSVQAGPVGAYTSSPPTHVTICSTDPGYQGLAALEMLFHEASHAWGFRLRNGIARAGKEHGKEVPDQLWHAVLFYNAGELTRRTLQEDGVPGYVEEAVRQSIYLPLCGEGCRARVAAAWDPHLAGEATLESALDALVAAWPVPSAE